MEKRKNDMEEKLDRLLRWHRQSVFEDGETGERHARALRRLKKTATARRVFAAREDASRDRASARLLRMYA
jgi:hypothetical protein